MTSQSAEFLYSSVNVRKQTEEQTSSMEIQEYLKLISMSLCSVPHVAAAEICWRIKTIENFTSVVPAAVSVALLKESSSPPGLKFCGSGSVSS